MRKKFETDPEKLHSKILFSFGHDLYRSYGAFALALYTIRYGYEWMENAIQYTRNLPHFEILSRINEFDSNAFMVVHIALHKIYYVMYFCIIIN